MFTERSVPAVVGVTTIEPSVLETSLASIFSASCSIASSVAAESLSTLLSTASMASLSSETVSSVAAESLSTLLSTASMASLTESNASCKPLRPIV